MRRSIYKWHKIIGLTTIIPVIFWCLSGLMHPFLSHWFKPQIAHEWMEVQPVNKAQLKLTLQAALKQNKVNSFLRFRLASFEGRTYYQVKISEQVWRYFDTETGVELKDGDRRYAVFLARYFLDDQTSKVKQIAMQTEFDTEYKYINRLLPVWKVSFDRPDNMDVYVETGYNRLATFNPTSRKAFLWIFETFHNWGFLSFIANDTLRIAIMLLFLTIITLSTLSGVVIYGFMWKQFKQNKPTDKNGLLRKYHRQIGIAVSLVSLTFSFSGGYHATRKLKPNTLPQLISERTIQTGDLTVDFKELDTTKQLLNGSVVKWGNNTYYQLYAPATTGFGSEVNYFDAANGNKVPDGDFTYAKQLMTTLYGEKNCNNKAQDCCDEEGGGASANCSKQVIRCENVAEFEKREYGFAFKRLPVVRVSLQTADKTNVYVETATSRIAAIVANSDRYEGYSFAIFHKFLFVDFLGKNGRDLIMLFSALGVLVVSLFGLVLFLRTGK